MELPTGKEVAEGEGDGVRSWGNTLVLSGEVPKTRELKGTVS